MRRSLVLAGTCVGRGLRVEDAVVDRDRLGHIRRASWLSVTDPRILGDTRAPVLPDPGSLAGRLVATVLLAATAPVWAPILAALAVESGGRPLRARRVVSRRGRVGALHRPSHHRPEPAGLTPHETMREYDG